jgi:hypothetical protein
VPDVPPIIFWRTTTGVVLTGLPSRPVDAPDLKPRQRKNWIPYGVTAWQLSGERVWHRLSELPPEWGLKFKGGGTPAPARIKGTIEDTLEDEED